MCARTPYSTKLFFSLLCCPHTHAPTHAHTHTRTHVHTPALQPLASHCGSTPHAGTLECVCISGQIGIYNRTKCVCMHSSRGEGSLHAWSPSVITPLLWVSSFLRTGPQSGGKGQKILSRLLLRSGNVSATVPLFSFYLSVLSAHPVC